jgi:predicted dehydrogenase
VAESVTSVGIIGCGLIGLRRAKAARSLGGIVVAAADTARNRAEELLHSVGSTALPATDWRDVVSRKPDLVIVATTHDCLAEISAVAAIAGCHVLVEKPAARSAAELEPVMAAAKSSGVLVRVGFNHRFHPALRKARSIVESGALGPLLMVRGRYGHGGRLGYDKEWRCDKAKAGGGELIDQGSHLIDLARWFLGDFSEVAGHVATLFWDIAVDDNCFLNLRTPRGQVAWLHASWSEWKNTFSFEIYGRSGKLQVDGLGGSYGPERLTHYRMLPQMAPPAAETEEFPAPDASWQMELAELFDAVQHGNRAFGNLSDAHANLAIIDRIYGSETR